MKFSDDEPELPENEDISKFYSDISDEELPEYSDISDDELPDFL